VTPIYVQLLLGAIFLTIAMLLGVGRGIMTEAQEKIVREFESAASAIRRQPSGNAGKGAEAKYGAAYQRLVQAGLAPQLRSRYR